MHDPIVSVIIPTYNREKQCQRAVQSVLNQEDCIAEIIVVDDGSTDNTKNYLSIFGDRINYFYQNNQGASAARNLGLDNARGKYIAFLDADDYFTPKHLKDSLAFLREAQDIDFVFSNTIRGKDPENKAISFLDGKEIPGVGMYHENMDIEILSDDTWLQIIKGNIIPPSTSVMNRDVIHKQRFSIQYPVANDTEFLSRILQGVKVAFLNKIGAYCEEGGDNLTGKTHNLVRIKLKLQLIDSHLLKINEENERRQLTALKKHFLLQISSHYWNHGNKIKALALRLKSKFIAG